MNVLFFLTPKSEVAYIYDDYTMRQTLEKMEYHRYSSIPIINKKGEYVGTMTEGDLLWSIKNDFDLNLKSLEDICISSVRRKMDNKPISVNANIEDLVSKSMNQNFVPVIDDQNIFIGIIKRRDIIDYCYNKILS
ncbi:MAG: CBS domain-containing protein [Peptostreptococcaceae bacterium]|nr:CBS domain-containing protein [Peptostreptococcaceae bacterium]